MGLDNQLLNNIHLLTRLLQTLRIGRCPLRHCRVPAFRLGDERRPLCLPVLRTIPPWRFWNGSRLSALPCRRDCSAWSLPDQRPWHRVLLSTYSSPRTLSLASQTFLGPNKERTPSHHATRIVHQALHILTSIGSQRARDHNLWHLQSNTSLLGSVEPCRSKMW